MTEILIATRRYELDGYRCEDRMLRLGQGFVLRRTAGGHPQEVDNEVGYSLAECFQWLREESQQIERAAVSG